MVLVSRPYATRYDRAGVGRRRPDGRDRARRAPAAERPEPLRHRCLRRHRGRRRWPARPHGQRLCGRLAGPAAGARLDRQAGKGHRLLGDAPFTVNVLGAEQEAVARHFSGDPHPDRVHWAAGSVAPTLAGVLATFECRPWREVRRRRPHAVRRRGRRLRLPGRGRARRTSRAASRRSRSPRWASSISSRAEGAPMGARTGREYVEALDERAIHVEIEGRATHGPRLGDPPAP